MSIRKAMVTSLAVPAFAAAAAHAAEIGPYFGASVGQATAKADAKLLVDDGAGDFDKQETGYSCRGSAAIPPTTRRPWQAAASTARRI